MIDTPNITAIATAIGANPTEGWHWPKGSRVAHYLRGGVSLCGRWICHKSVVVSDRRPSPTDCAACRHQLGRPRRTPAA